MLPPQQAGWIEVILGQFPQRGRGSGRKAQPDIDAFPILQRNGGPRPRIFFALELPPIAFAKPQKKGFDVLAGSQGVDGEVRARTVVFEQPGPAHGYTVGFPAGGLDAIVAVRLASRLFQHLGDGGCGALLAFGNLLLD